MTFVHPLRSPRAPAEGSMEKSLLLAFLHQQGRPPAPIASATSEGTLRRGKERRKKEVRHTSRVPILTSQSSPGER